MKIDFSNPNWSYILGVIHGDGNVSKRSVSVSVSHKSPEYVRTISLIWKKLGYNPKIYNKRSCVCIDVHSKELAECIKKYKDNGVWHMPKNIDKFQWLSGIYDTDGCVSDPLKKRAINITLKRTGNIKHVVAALSKCGIRVKAYNRTSKYLGRDYEIEVANITSLDGIIKFNEKISLRHRKKSARLKQAVKYANNYFSVVPLWLKIANYMKSPQTSQTVKRHFKISQDTFESCLQLIKRKCKVKTIPPPKTLTQYQVSQ